MCKVWDTATNAILETIFICLDIQTFHHLNAHIQGDETVFFFFFSRQLLILRIQHCTLTLQYTLIEQSLHAQSYGDVLTQQNRSEGFSLKYINCCKQQAFNVFPFWDTCQTRLFYR